MIVALAVLVVVVEIALDTEALVSGAASVVCKYEGVNIGGGHDDNLLAVIF